MRTNVRGVNPLKTHEGAPAKNISNVEQLRRSVMSCMLWEGEFYEDGVTIADRIKTLAEGVSPSEVATMAIEARHTMKLRHVPLLLLEVLTRTGAGTSLVSETIARVISRADELAEFVAIYMKDGKRPLSKQAKLGLAKAFLKFDEYALDKYNRDGPVTLRDVLFMCHAKPDTEERADLWKRLVDGNLKSAGTWENRLSAGEDKGKTFETMLEEGQLGYMALLRNLRNFEQTGVKKSLVRKALLDRQGASRVLPFRFITALKYGPSFGRELDAAFQMSIDAMDAVEGETLLLVDVSMSMNAQLSGKSELSRRDAAAALAAMWPGPARVFTFDTSCREVSNIPGLGMIEAINKSGGGMTHLGAAVTKMNGIKADRLVVITDEQSQDKVPDSVHDKSYMINVASNQNGVGYHKWTHIDGFSEGVLNFIREVEAL